MKHQANFYETIASITKNTPNNMELGTSIRSLINKIEDSKKKEAIKDPNQVTIFQDLENYGS
jgi:hypothetical protein